MNKLSSLSYNRNSSTSSETIAIRSILEENDLAPHEYYNLGAVLLEPSEYYYHKSEDNNVSNLLLLHARSLANDPRALFESIRSIYMYTHQLPMEAFELHLKDWEPKLNGILNMERECNFMRCMIKLYKNTMSSKMIKLLQCNSEKRAVKNVKSIIFLDIRITRLLSLFHIIHSENINSDTSNGVTNSFQKTPEEESHENVPSLDDSFSIICKPSVTADLESSLIESIDMSSELSHTNNKSNIISSQITDYHALSTQELKSRVEGNGYKEASRDQMIGNLQQRYQRKQSSFNYDAYNRKAIEKYIIEKRSDLWNSIITFKPVSLLEVMECLEDQWHANTVMSFLNEMRAVVIVDMLCCSSSVSDSYVLYNEN